MGVSKQAICNLEGETSNPSIRTLEKYARAIGVKLVISERT